MHINRQLFKKGYRSWCETTVHTELGGNQTYIALSIAEVKSFRVEAVREISWIKGSQAAKRGASLIGQVKNCQSKSVIAYVYE